MLRGQSPLATELVRFTDGPAATGFSTLAPRTVGSCREAFAEHGFLLFRNAVDPDGLERLRLRLLAEFERGRAQGSLFAGGGLVSGHINCFPGEESRFVYDALERRGIIDFVRSLSPGPLGAPNVGCNLNLPGSRAQNYHVDGYATDPFLIVNVAAVDTDLVNGAMEILERTHLRAYKYWQLVLADPPAQRVLMRRGDVLVRTSLLWHRGMPNLSSTPRPMLAFTWENGGSALGDPYTVNEGKIAFFPNRYATGFSGRIQERAFASAPGLGSAYRFLRSLIGN